MRLEEAIRRKRARPDDEGGRPDVAMEVAARHPFQHGGSSSSWEVRPEPSRRRDAEEQLGGDVVTARLQDPQGVVRRRGNSRVKSSRPLWTRSASMPRSWVRCTWQNRTSVRFSCQDVRRSWRAPSASSQVRLWTCGMDGTWPRRAVDRSAGGRDMQSVQSW